jgi:hypothetical protein
MPYKDPEKTRAYNAAYYAANRDELLAYQNDYYAEHREERIARHWNVAMTLIRIRIEERLGTI